MKEKPLRALARDGAGDPVYIVGLAEEHLAHVREGKTVIIEMTAFGHRGTILIYGGADQADLLRQIGGSLSGATAFLDGMKPVRRQ
jgi:hypothetical protein